MKNHSWTPQIWFHPIPRRSIAIIPSLGWERLKTSEHRQNSGTWEFKDMIPSHSHIKFPHSMFSNSTKYLLSSASTMVSGCFRWMKGIHKDYHYHVEQNRSLRSELKLSLIMSSQLHRVLWLIHWQAFAGDEGVLARRDIVKNRQEQGNIVQLQCGLAILFALLETWPTVFHSINSPRLSISSLHVWWQSTGKLSSAVPESNNKKFMNWSWQNVEGDKSHGASFVRRGRREIDWE